MNDVNKKIVVTGGCGYIGSHVARAFKFANPDNEVIIVDRVRRDHTLVGTDGFMENDFADDVVLATIADIEPDVIVHCAGTSLVAPSVNDPADYYDNNVAKTIKLLNLVSGMAKQPVIMFSSSASVYGVPDEFPVNESAAVQPISPYGRSKAIVETILQDYGRAYGLTSVCFRYFNAAGADPFTTTLGQEPGATHIIARVLESLLNKTEFTLYGTDFNTPDGTCVRDYVHVWDIALAHVKALEHVIANRPSLIVNLGTETGVSNKEIIDYVQERYGNFKVVEGPRREGDPDMLVASHWLANHTLGWTPQYSNIQDIIDSAYKWYCASQ